MIYCEKETYFGMVDSIDIKDGTLTFPKDTKEIDKITCLNQEQLKKIILPPNIYYMEALEIIDCENLEEIEIYYNTNVEYMPQKRRYPKTNLYIMKRDNPYGHNIKTILFAERDYKIEGLSSRESTIVISQMYKNELLLNVDMNQFLLTEGDIIDLGQSPLFRINFDSLYEYKQRKQKRKIMQRENNNGT